MKKIIRFLSLLGALIMLLGTVSVTGGKISGHTGIEMCAGKLVVKDGTITSTGANKDETGSQNAILDGAAISIINRNYPGGVPTAEITGILDR